MPLILIPFEGLQLLTLKVPEYDGFVITSRGNRLTVGAEHYAVDYIFMPFEGFQLLTLKVPEYDGSVITSQGNRLAVGAGVHPNFAKILKCDR